MEYIAYIRVSSKYQTFNKSSKPSIDHIVDGFGLRAQMASVNEFVKKRGATLLETYKEVESGSTQDRPELNKAITACKTERCTLLVARLDRLSRSVSLVQDLYKSKVDFVCADMPEADKFVIQILAALAERERDNISRNTKAALAQSKIRREAEGRPRKRPAPLTPEQKRANTVRRRAKYCYRILHNENVKNSMRFYDKLLSKGMSTHESVKIMNDSGFRDERNNPWSDQKLKEKHFLIKSGYAAKIGQQIEVEQKSVIDNALKLEGLL